MLKQLLSGIVALSLLCGTAEAGTIYADVSGNGAAATNSGSTDTSSPLTNGTAAAWTSSTGSAASAFVNLPGSGYGASVSGTLTWSGAGCSVNPVLNVTTNAGGQIATASIGTAGTCTTFPGESATTWTVGGGLSAGSNAAFLLTMSQTITLDTNANLTGVVTTPGPTQSSIYLANSTNASSQQIFWISSVTGCTGSGACSITVTQLVSCTTCSGNIWTIGGRYLWPGSNTISAIEGMIGVSGGQDFLIFNTTPASKTGGYFSAHWSGTPVTGYPTIQGKSGVRPVLQDTASSGQLISLGNFSGWRISNLQLEYTNASNTNDLIVNVSGSSVIIDNIVAGPGFGALVTGGSIRLTNSEVTGLANGINVLAGGYFEGNYINGNSAAGINITQVGSEAVIVDNLITGNGAQGIVQSGNIAGTGNIIVIQGNTIANNTGIGIEITNGFAATTLRNNIVSNSGAVATVKYDFSAAELNGSHGYNVFWNGTGSGVTNLTLNATEFAADPLFVSAGSGNFAIGNSSPAAGSGWPGTPLNSSSIGHRDIGAIQRQVTAGGSGPVCFIGGG